MDQYLAAIKEKVCTHCIDGDGEGNCRIGNGKICPIEEHYPKITRSVFEAATRDYDVYVARLRSNVCRNCNYGKPEDCDERNDVECALDRYYPLVIRAIEEIGFEEMQSAYRAQRAS